MTATGRRGRTPRPGPFDRERLQAALGVSVASVEVLEEASGTTRRARLRVRHADGSATELFAKAPASSPLARAVVALPGLARAEVGFYRDVAPEAPLSIPTCHAARATRTDFLLVLEDVSSRPASFSHLGDDLPAPQVAEVLAQLARLHGAYWGDPRLRSGAWPWCRPLVPRFEATAGALVAPALGRIGARRAGGALPGDLRRVLLRYGAHRSALRRRLDCGTPTLLHQDCHPGNLAFAEDGSAVVCDWQLTRAGPWAADVAYLVATAMAVEERRAHDAALLAGYLDHLVDAGGRPPGAAEAKRAFAANLVYPLEAMVVTLAFPGLQPDDAVRRAVARSAAAAADHDAFGALASLDARP